MSQVTFDELISGQLQFVKLHAISFRAEIGKAVNLT